MLILKLSELKSLFPIRKDYILKLYSKKYLFYHLFIKQINTLTH